MMLKLKKGRRAPSPAEQIRSAPKVDEGGVGEATSQPASQNGSAPNDQPSISINGKSIQELYPSATAADVEAFLGALQKAADEDWSFLEEYEKSLNTCEIKQEAQQLATAKGGSIHEGEDGAVVYIPCKAKGKFIEEEDGAIDAVADEPIMEPNVEACLEGRNIIVGFHDAATVATSEDDESEESGFDWGRAAYNLSLQIDGAIAKTIAVGATSLIMMNTLIAASERTAAEETSPIDNRNDKEQSFPAIECSEEERQEATEEDINGPLHSF
ncbi:hypothetical protein ACHAXT_004121 [Thalassiosira profunda]